MDLLRARGAQPISMPLFDIEALPHIELLQLKLRDALEHTGWIFTSANAARLAADLVEGPWPRQFAIGQATATALRTLGHGPAELAPQGSTSEALLDHPALRNVRGQHFLICTGVNGRVQLEQTLRERGAQVERVELYRRVPRAYTPDQVGAVLQQIDAILCTSAENVERLHQLAPAAQHRQLLTRVLVLPSPRVLELARRLGFEAIFAPDHTSDEAFVHCLEQACSQHSAQHQP